MAEHQQKTEEVAESAALYALGVMSEAERSALERHLGEGCSVCQTEINRCGELIAALAQGAAVSPPASLRQKLLQTIRQAPTALPSTGSPVLLEKSGLR